MAGSTTYRRYIALCTALALGAVARALALTESFPPLPTLMALLSSYVLLQGMQLVLPSGQGLSFASAVALTALATLGAGPAVLLVAGGGLLTGIALRSPFDRACLNSSIAVLCTGIAAVASGLVRGALGQDTRGGFPDLFAAVITYWAAELVFGTATIAVYKQRSVWTCLRDLGRVPLFSMLAADAASIPAVFAYGRWGCAIGLGLVLAVAAAASLLARELADRSHRRLLATLLPTASHDHPAKPRTEMSSALGQAVSELALAAGLGLEESDALRWAALLHDSGLSETTTEASTASEPLSEEQLQKIQEHPLRASLKVGQVGNLLWVARILETHHEHHNGWGYPFGLKGDEIPLPAALLGLAEAYLALITPRPYRPRTMTPAEALRHLKTRAGEQFSPAAVAALDKCLGSGTLGEGETAVHHVVEAAVGRLRRLGGTPRLPAHVLHAGPGPDVWSRGQGGPRRFFERLFTRHPLRVRHYEKDLPGDWYRSLFDLGRVFSSSLDVQVIAKQLADAVHGLTTLPCIVHLVRDDSVTLVPAAVSGIPEQAVTGLKQGIGEGLLGLAVAEDRPVTSLSLVDDPRSVHQEWAKTLGVKSSLCVPLRAGETPLGGFSVNSPTVRRFSPIEVRALAALGNIAALALHNAFLYRKASNRLDQLIEAQLYLSTVFDTVPAGIVTLGSGGNLVSCNRQASRYLAELGLSGPEVGCGCGLHSPPGGKAGPDLVHLLRDRLEAEAPLRALETQRPCGPDTVSAALPEGERFLEIWASPLRDSTGHAAGLLVVLDDVTEAKRLAAEVERTEKLATIGEVAAKAAHEIKNPLASIRGLTQLLGLYCPVREQWNECPRYVGLIAGEVDRLTGITQSMLTLARPARPELAVGDLSAVVAETVALLSGKASAQGTTLGLASGSTGPAGVLAEFDAPQIRQVLLNLVENALDALSGPYGPPRGWRKVTVSLGYRRRDDRRYAFVQVRDNGPGIRAEDRPKVFTPFFTTKETGTGLGLAISKSIAEAHGGMIELRPARGRGCVFEVLLPASGGANAELSTRLAVGPRSEVAEPETPPVPAVELDSLDASTDSECPLPADDGAPPKTGGARLGRGGHIGWSPH